MRKVAVALTFAMAVTSAQAGRYLNTIDDTATIHNDGRLIAIGGPIGCPEGNAIEVRVLISRDGVAIGDGEFSAICSGEPERWHALVENWGGPVEAGAADARAWAKTWDGETLTKGWNWGKPVTLLRADSERARAD